MSLNIYHPLNFAKILGLPRSDVGPNISERVKVQLSENDFLFCFFLARLLTYGRACIPNMQDLYWLITGTAPHIFGTLDTSSYMSLALFNLALDM